MTRLILRQIWNQRRQNFWIWLELTLLSTFLWLAIDPLFTMVCITQMPRGYDQKRLYIISPVYDITTNYLDTRNFVPQTDYLLTQLQSHPMVESVCLCNEGSLPGMSGTHGIRLYHNRQEAGTDVDLQAMERANGSYMACVNVPCHEGLEQWSDLPGVLGLRDAATGQYIHGRTDADMKEHAYISAGLARQFYGTLHAQDSTMFFLTDRITGNGPELDERNARVKAVFADIKMHDYETPSPVLMTANGGHLLDVTPLVRLKAGVDEDAFRAAMERDVLPRCTMDKVKGYEIKPLQETARKATERSGAYNVIRLRSAMGFFGLLCAFLGVSGLFWVRCNDRRQDMGVMRSMGATRRGVCRQMLTEATLLLTLAWVPAMLYIMWHVHANGYDVGMAESSLAGKADLAYWFLRPWPHVLAVTAISYTAMLLITLLATWLPVQRATRILPSDALRDE